MGSLPHRQAPEISKPAVFISSANVMGGYAETMKGAVMLIMAFYFAAPHMGNIAQDVLDKFGGKKIKVQTKVQI